MRTVWGYDVEGVAPLLSLEAFDRLTGGSYGGSERAETALFAASQAVRNYCGWHISPSLECIAHPVGGGKVIKLPAGYVSEILLVKEDGEILAPERFEWRTDGLLRRACFRNWVGGWGAIKVVYRAGYPIESAPDLAEAVRAIAEGVLAVSAGVTSESADGVTISYSQNASSIAAALTSAQRGALEIYKVVNSYGA